MQATGDVEPIPSPVVINIGGEREVPEALNVNRKWLADPEWHSMRPGNPTLRELETAGHRFLLTDLHPLPFADQSVDAVYTNNVCFDKDSWLGPCPRESEIWRILKPTGRWINDAMEKQRP